MVSNGKNRTYEYSAESVWQDEVPETAAQAFASGCQYYEKFLKGILPGLYLKLDKLANDNELPPEEIQCVFLDRDARPAMYAFEHYARQTSRYGVCPVPVSTIMVGELFNEYARFDDLNYGEITLAQSWSEEFKKRLELFIQYYDEAKQWIEAFQHTLASKMKDKEMIVLIDIGYRGSAVEVAKYLLQKAFPNKKVESILIYKYSESIPINSVVSGATSWYAESSIPHSTRGFALSGRDYKYIRGFAPSEIESAFYRGVISSAEADV